MSKVSLAVGGLNDSIMLGATSVGTHYTPILPAIKCVWGRRPADRLDGRTDGWWTGGCISLVFRRFTEVDARDYGGSGHAAPDDRAIVITGQRSGMGIEPQPDGQWLKSGRPMHRSRDMRQALLSRRPWLTVSGRPMYGRLK